jgi:hypothetical protein
MADSARALTNYADAEFKENEHPRGGGGKFVSEGGGESKAKSEPPAPESEKKSSPSKPIADSKK